MGAANNKQIRPLRFGHGLRMSCAASSKGSCINAPVLAKCAVRPLLNDVLFFPILFCNWAAPRAHAHCRPNTTSRPPSACDVGTNTSNTSYHLSKLDLFSKGQAEREQSGMLTRRPTECAERRHVGEGLHSQLFKGQFSAALPCNHTAYLLGRQRRQ